MLTIIMIEPVPVRLTFEVASVTGCVPTVSGRTPSSELSNSKVPSSHEASKVLRVQALKPRSHSKLHCVPFGQMATPSESVGHGVEQLVAPHVAGLRSRAQVLPQGCESGSQATPQLVPSQLARPLAGTGQAVHEVPQVSELKFETQRPAQSWKPALHTMPQRVPSQVACPSGPGLGQRVHEVPQELGLERGKHCPLQSWNPSRQDMPQLVPLQVAWPLARLGHGVQEPPHEFVLPFGRQSPLQS